MNHIKHDWPDDDSVNRLFEIVHGEEIEPDNLSDSDRIALEQIRKTLIVIDSAWAVAPERLKRIESLFYQKLAAQDPNHPWIKANEIQTLGELAQANSSELPLLLEPVRVALFNDQTPLEILTNPNERTVAVGRFIQGAKLPMPQITGFLNWLNACLSELIPAPANESKFVFTRRPNPVSRPRITSQSTKEIDEEKSGG